MQFYEEDEYLDLDDFDMLDINEYIVPIWETDFEKNLEKVLTYRKRFKSKVKYGTEFLKNIIIKNYGDIKRIEIEKIKPKNKWIFLTGENGAGKTTILKAIATAFCQNTDNKKTIQTSMYNDFNIETTISDDINDSKIYQATPNTFIKENNLITKGFAAYGAIRIITENSTDSNMSIDIEFLRNSNVYSLFGSVGILKDLKNSYPLFVKSGEMDLAIDSVIENLEHIIPNIGRIDNHLEELHFLEYFELDEDGRLIDIPRKFEELPSGTRSIAAFILDLLITLQRQQPNINDMADYSGVVLIDEIDIHLHPKLQFEFIHQLSETFPKIQFIVTTHSPIPLLGAPDNSVIYRVLKTRDKGIYVERLKKLEREIKFLLPNTLLTSDIFDFDIFSNIDDKDFNKIPLEDDYNQIDENKKIDNSLKSIDKSIFPDDLFRKKKK